MWNWKHARQQFDILHSSWMAHNWGTLYIFLHPHSWGSHRETSTTTVKAGIGSTMRKCNTKKSERGHKKSLWMSEKLTKMLLLWRWNSLTMKKKRELFIVRSKKRACKIIKHRLICGFNLKSICMKKKKKLKKKFWKYLYHFLFRIRTFDFSLVIEFYFLILDF